VLFIFRSRYLCAIGLPKIFSLGRGIPAIRTAFPSSTTPKVPRCCFAQRPENGAITLLGAPFQEDFSSMRKYKELHTPQFGTGPIRLGLFPLRSPLLGESLLFSFPPLNDMLKFSGWSTTAQALENKYWYETKCLRA
jgi:hypothetical protein